MQEILQGSKKNASSDPLFDNDLAVIKRQVSHWDQQFGSVKVSQYLFDVAFFRLSEQQGFQYANNLLITTRKALKRSVGSHAQKTARAA